MKNKIIRLKTAGVIALPALGIIVGFFSGMGAAQALNSTRKIITPCAHTITIPTRIEPIDAVEYSDSTDHWRDLIEQKIDKAMQNPKKTPRQGIKNPIGSTKIECIEPLICDG